MIVSDTSKKIVSLQEIQKLREQWKKEQKKVVFTNGCFDILHLGHVDYLEKASRLGDVLLVAVNTDESVRRLKGETRPMNPLYARMRLLAALAFVDAVVSFSEDTPHALICQLLPDVLVKGNDYTIENIVGAKEVLANGGEVKTIELVEGFSTTSLIRKMRNT